MRERILAAASLMMCLLLSSNPQALGQTSSQASSEIEIHLTHSTLSDKPAIVVHMTVRGQDIEIYASSLAVMRNDVEAVFKAEEGGIGVQCGVKPSHLQVTKAALKIAPGKERAKIYYIDGHNPGRMELGNLFVMFDSLTLSDRDRRIEVNVRERLLGIRFDNSKADLLFDRAEIDIEKNEVSFLGRAQLKL